MCRHQDLIIKGSFYCATIAYLVELNAITGGHQESCQRPRKIDVPIAVGEPPSVLPLKPPSFSLARLTRKRFVFTHFLLESSGYTYC